MHKISEIIKILQEIAPEENTLEGFCDNVGLVLGRDDSETDKVLCCLDVTAEVIDEAIRIGAGLIVSHHPFVFSPVKKITSNDVLGEKIIRVIEAGIAVYSAHTNLDIAAGGINDYVARLFGLKSISVMFPQADGFGLGRIGNLSVPQQLSSLAKRTEEILGDRTVRVIAKEDCLIHRVSVINGAGGDIRNVDAALASGAQCLITADVRYHAALYAAERGLAIIEPTHYGMEQIFMQKLVQTLTDRAGGVLNNVMFFVALYEKTPYFAR